MHTNFVKEKRISLAKFSPIFVLETDNDEKLPHVNWVVIKRCRFEEFQKVEIVLQRNPRT